MSLLNILVGSGLIDIINFLGLLIGQDAVRPGLLASIVIFLSALFGTVMMLSLAQTLPDSLDKPTSFQSAVGSAGKDITFSLSVVMMLQGQ